jgi:hypothetical protein
MSQSPLSNINQRQSVVFEFGTFEGFNFRNQSAIFERLTTDDVINWDHDRNGEAEFWPSGDKPEVQLLFKTCSTVTASEIVQLDNLLQDLGDDSIQHYLQIFYAVNVQGANLETLGAQDIESQNLYLFTSDSVLDLRRDAAYELFELYYPEEYKVWEKSTCDGLDFDPDQFLNSPSFYVEEVAIGSQKWLLVSRQ